MSPERWRQIEALYHSAQAAAPGAERDRLLAGADPELCREVESLLTQEGSLLSQPLAASGITDVSQTTIVSGTQIGPYRLEHPIGTGGMGQVFRATDTKLNRAVAVKFLSSDVHDVAARRRFQREAQMASSLNHPHILTVHDAGELDGMQYLVAEYVDGGTLSDWLKREPRTWRQVVDLLTGVADGLAVAHAANILHRDIKPANILVTQSGYAKLADFGLARLDDPGGTPSTGEVTMTGAGMILGTVPYMSPEQASGEKLDARSDIFSFGIVLYEALCGRRPFAGTNQLETMHNIVHNAPQPMAGEIPAVLQGIVGKALAKDVGARYPTMRDMVTDLRGLASLTTGPQPIPLKPTRQWMWVAAGAVVVIAVTAGIWSKSEAKAAPTLSNGGQPSASKEANDLAELGMGLARVRNDIPAALAVFERALAIDPHFSDVHLSHALWTVVNILNGYSNDGSTFFKAEQELQQVERESPDAVNLPQTQTLVYLVQGRLDRIPRATLEQRWRSNNGQPSESALLLAILNVLAGREKEAIDILQVEVGRDPLSGPKRQMLGEAMRSAGDADGAIRAQQRVLEQAPGNITAACFLATAFLDQNRKAEARALLERMRPEFEKNYTWRHGWALLLAAEGKRAEALTAMDDEVLKYAQLVWRVTAATADFYTMVGDQSKAFEWLERAVNRGDERISYFQRNPRLASLRNDPRFQTIVRSVEARRK